MSGGYVNFGVFELYGDTALRDALDVALRMVTSIPQADIMGFKCGLWGGAGGGGCGREDIERGRGAARPAPRTRPAARPLNRSDAPHPPSPCPPPLPAPPL
jgi:hypothetical protein